MGERPLVGGVLCAGLGTRMRPLTESVPKPLLPFLNTPLLTYALQHMGAAGVERVGMNLYHLPEAFPPVAKPLCAQFGLDPVFSREWELMGTAGGIRGIWHALEEPDATLVVTNGDSVMNLDLAERLEAHRASGADATLMVRPKKDDQPGGVWLDDDRELAGIRDYRRPGADRDPSLTQYEFMGVHFLEPELLDELPLEKGDVIDELYGPALEEDADVTAQVYDDFWAALDNPELYMATTRQILDAPETFDQAPLEATDREGVYAADPEVADVDAEFEPPVFLGNHVEIEEGASVGPYAVVDGVEIARGAEIEEAVLYSVGEVRDRHESCIEVTDQFVRVDD